MKEKLIVRMLKNRTQEDSEESFTYDATLQPCELYVLYKIDTYLRI